MNSTNTLIKRKITCSCINCCPSPLDIFSLNISTSSENILRPNFSVYFLFTQFFFASDPLQKHFLFRSLKGQTVQVKPFQQYIKSLFFYMHLRKWMCMHVHDQRQRPKRGSALQFYLACRSQSSVTPPAPPPPPPSLPSFGVLFTSHTLLSLS